MNIVVAKKIFERCLSDPLYKNSLYLILSRILNVAFGFLFWMLAARIYSIEEVGLATGLLSSLSLVILLSRLGFDVSLIRYLPINDKSEVFNTCIIVTTISSVIIGIIYILSIDLFSPTLSFIKNPIYGTVFLFIAVMNSITMTTGNAFVAIRKSKQYFLQNVLLGLRIVLLIPLTFAGSFGIFGSVGIAYFFASIFAFLLLSKFIDFKFNIHRHFIDESFKFTSWNYIANVLFVVPTSILPILILNVLGDANAAKYYIAFAVGNLVLIIPDALKTSLFVEGSYGENLRQNVTKAGFAICLFLIPMVIFVYVFSGHLLGLFGEDYIEAIELLRIFVLSSFFVTAYSLFIPIQNVRMEVGSIIKINSIRFVLLIGLSYIFMLKFGIVGVGYAWIITYGTLVLIVTNLARRLRWI